MKRFRWFRALSLSVCLVFLVAGVAVAGSTWMTGSPGSANLAGNVYGINPGLSDPYGTTNTWLQVTGITVARITACAQYNLGSNICATNQVDNQVWSPNADKGSFWCNSTDTVLGSGSYSDTLYGSGSLAGKVTNFC